MQPTLGAGNNFYQPWLQANFFMQLSIHCIFRRLIAVYPALRKLPRVLPNTARPQQPAHTIGNHNANI
jgi:hypothetical protein